MSSSLIPATQSLTLEIDGMGCGHCIAAVTRAAESVPGVAVEQVLLGRCTVFIEPGTPAAEWLLDAIRDAGYQARVAD